MTSLTAPPTFTTSPIATVYAFLGQPRVGLELLDLAQASPSYGPAPEVIAHLEEVAGSGVSGAAYTPTPGLDKLREALATELGPGVTPDNVLITAGCNQAFCLTAMALARRGEEVIVQEPYYFNHHMWLEIQGITPAYLPGEDGLVPSVERARRLVTDRTRAVVLVSPGNPTGVTLPPAVIDEFGELARQTGVPLVLDETYRTFRGTTDAAHGLYDRADWPASVVTLHSFSKDLAIPGYRVGAVVASTEMVEHLASFMDCVALCAPRIGQEAAWAGLTMSGTWRADRAAEVGRNAGAFRDAMAERPGGFELLGCGGYFGWMRHPFAGRHADDVARDLLLEHGVLVVPGTAFTTRDTGALRVSIGNLGAHSLEDLTARLRQAGVADR